jgi:hypothetical protein
MGGFFGGAVTYTNSQLVLNQAVTRDAAGTYFLDTVIPAKSIRTNSGSVLIVGAYEDAAGAGGTGIFDLEVFPNSSPLPTSGPYLDLISINDGLGQIDITWGISISYNGTNTLIASSQGYAYAAAVAGIAFSLGPSLAYPKVIDWTVDNRCVIRLYASNTPYTAVAGEAFALSGGVGNAFAQVVG